MSKVSFEGLAEFMDDLKNVMDLPEEVQLEMLNAEADVVVEAQKREIESLGLEDTGQMKKSIARTAKLQSSKTGIGKYLDVYPQGTREDGVRNAEIGFIHEFGAPKRHIRASGWMEKANEKCATEAVGAAEEVYDNFLKKNNL